MSNGTRTEDYAVVYEDARKSDWQPICVSADTGSSLVFKKDRGQAQRELLLPSPVFK